jgi:hypothetical protein
VLNICFVTVSQANDIALLFLVTPMKLAPNVGLACLTEAMERPTPGTRCIVTGWGYDRFHGSVQNIMKVVMYHHDLLQHISFI